MPKATFLNLPSEKKTKIEAVLIKLLSENQPSQVTVKMIIDQVDFSRAAFYKYFYDLSDAVNHVTKIAADFVHQAIMQEIMQTNDFLLGSRNYLAAVAEYNQGSRERQLIKVLLNGGNTLLFKRTLSSKNEQLTAHFLKLLADNHLNIKDNSEAISFLYFMMSLVINALFEFTTNNWSKEELLQDFDFRVKWIEQGLKN